MAKTKKLQSEAPKIDAKGKKDKKPAKNLKKVSKPRTHPPFAEMVTEALTGMKNRKGHTLVAIRQYIAANYGLEINKRQQTVIKQFIESEFKEDRIIMTNHDGDKINFSKRFRLVSSKTE